MDPTSRSVRFPSAAMPPRLAALVLSLCASFSANAIGIAMPTSAPVIGRALNLELPLQLGPGESVPRPECVRLVAVGDPQFFPRNARATVHLGDRPRVRIASSDAVAEPMLEFRLLLGCDSVVARDFLVLAEAPGSAQATATPVPRPVDARQDISIEALEAKAASRPRPVAARDGGQMLRLAVATNLNALARARYPASLALRDEFRRLMAEANPGLFAGAKHVGMVPLAAGTSLAMPDRLPQGGPEPARPVNVPATRGGGLMKVAASFDAPAIAAATPRAGKADRLVVGVPALRAPAPLSARELAGAIDRIERMVEDQGRTELQLVGGLDTVNSAFVEMKDFVQMLDTDQRQLQRAQKVLERRLDSLPEPKSLGLFELLGLILVGGGVVAGLITLNHGLQMRRIADVPAPEPEPAPAPRWVPPAKGTLDFV